MIETIVMGFACLLFYYLCFVLLTVKQHNGCEGYCLFKFYRFQIEIWFCPAGHNRELHKHPNEHTGLWFLKGGGTVIRKARACEDCIHEVESRDLSWPRDYFKLYYLPPNQYHGFTVGGKKLIFLNFQRWTCPITSACEDYVALQPKLDL